VEAIHNLLQSSAEVARFMGNYMLPQSARHNVITGLFSGKISPLAFRFVLFVERKKRGRILGQICSAYVDLHDQVLGIVKGLLSAPFELEEEDVRAVTAYARKKTEGQLRLSTLLEPPLLGGFKLRLGDTVYDASVAAQLNMLKEKLANA